MAIHAAFAELPLPERFAALMEVVYWLRNEHDAYIAHLEFTKETLDRAMSLEFVDMSV